MVVVLDTNVLLVSIPVKSLYRLIFDALVVGKFELILSNGILTEYTEVIERKANVIVANNIAEMVYFDWKLMDIDPDDNKYVDAAMAGSADFIVSNDQHFNHLKSIGFPKVTVLDI